MTLAELRSRRDEILRIAERWGGARRVRVFGSVARGDSTPSSDVDLLVELEMVVERDITPLETTLTALLRAETPSPE